MTHVPEKAAWVDRLPTGLPLKDELGRLVDADHNEAETDYYEAASEPLFLQLETEQRRYRGRFLRRVRRRMTRGS